MIVRSSNLLFLIYLLFTLLTGGEATDPNEGMPQNAPARLAGQIEDKVLKVTANATRSEDGSEYELEVTLSNKTGTMVDIIADCGSYITIVHEEQPRDNRECAAVHSMGISKHSSETKQYDLPVGVIDNEELLIQIRYEDEGVRGTLELSLTAER
ncbi:hypothetical protein [Paenibacillus phocaensis]|uniref:hypothetical protein n=1 Tax=Paenibacillus phocaensis TaxID=1776378 RepID=UPI000839C9C2|nr:hypothetical protein [Paenibacillus phocaensis]